MMKSAYEIAMEKLERESGPAQKLTDQQRERIEEIDRRYEAKTAEQKVHFESKLRAATTAEEAATLRSEMVQELAALEHRQQREKEAVWEDAEA